MKVLLTGATGFIGYFLVQELVRREFYVRALVLPGEDAKRLESLGVEVVRGDLTDPGSISGLCDSIDTIFHLAGRVTDWGTRKQFHEAIYVATKNLLDEAADKSIRFVYASSIAALGMGRHLMGLKENDELYKSGIPYDESKRDTERLVRSYNSINKIDGTIIRPANVIGPGSVWVRDIIERFNGLFVPLIDGGRHSASLVYVENLVEGFILAATMDVARGKVYHLRDDYTVTWKQYVSDLGAIVGKKPHGNIPFSLAWGIGLLLDKSCAPIHLRPPLTRPAAAIMGRNNDVDTQRAQTELGWRTRVPYREAMEKIGAWVRETYPK